MAIAAMLSFLHNACNMFGFNWVDLVIVILLVATVVEGARIGLVSLLFTIAGFFATLLVAGWLFPHLVRFGDLTLRSIVNASLVLVTAAYAALRSFDVGQRIHWSFRIGKRTGSPKLKWLETALGALPGLIAGLTLVWLLGVAISRLPFAGFSNSISDSRIVQQLSRTLPPVPAVFADFNKHIDPNSQPYVFAQPKPYASFNYSLADADQAATKAANSVVRITSFACGGIMSGTGFALGQGLVATNAHVLAGVKRPIIKYQNASYEAVPVYFDPTLDVAILRVPGLTAPALALPLAPATVPLDTTVAILGYPNGNYRMSPGLVRNILAVSARDIYDQGNAGRGIYELQAQVDFGNSGSPVVLANGQVAGIVFSKSTDSPDHAYALTSLNMQAALSKAKTSTQRVSTRACRAAQ